MDHIYTLVQPLEPSGPHSSDTILIIMSRLVSSLGLNDGKSKKSKDTLVTVVKCINYIILVHICRFQNDFLDQFLVSHEGSVCSVIAQHAGVYLKLVTSLSPTGACTQIRIGVQENLSHIPLFCLT